MTYSIKNTKQNFINRFKVELLNSSNPLLIITKTPLEAENLKKRIEELRLDKSIHLIPNCETLPYDFFSPSNQIQNERIHVLGQKLDGNNSITIIAIQTLISPAPNPKRVLNNFGLLELGQELNKNNFIKKLINQGYEKTDLVSVVGTFAERGSIIDVFISSYLDPIRIELFGNEIESLRFFNQINQLTTRKVRSIDLKLPNEYPLDQEAISLFKENWRNTFNSYEGDSEIFKLIVNQKKAPGAEMYLPFFYDRKYTALDYVKDIDSIYISEGSLKNLKDFEELIKKRYSEYSYDVTRPLIQPEKLYLSYDKFISYINSKSITWIENKEKEKIERNKNSKPNEEKVMSTEVDFQSLPKKGDKVVHLSHGIGIFLGLKTIHSSLELTDCLEIEFARNSKLYVPISSIDLISKYHGPRSIKLDELGSRKWSKRKEKALQQSFDVAAELLETQARRKNSPSNKYFKPDKEYIKFCEGFAYEETSDQIKVIREVENDLCSDIPMDRIVCGEVGFGKTEVALRAVFITSFNNKLSCLLVPTTLLAHQHYDTFKERCHQFGIEIQYLSRAKSDKERKITLEKLSNNSVDLIIGTHALLQDSIELKNLGLLIVDEEHKFGVRQKEKIKQMKDDLNVLSLSATPIPRSLNLALSSLKDLSIIATAPSGRVAVNTFVHQFNENLIKEAIQRELLRGGQIYYLCNDLSLIEDRRMRLKKMFPTVKVDIGHGKMKPKEIEEVMVNFQKNIISILVCSTIIESGIDIPNANTLIVESANKLGLSQLHQLRGRVGRSNRQAFTYFLKDSNAGKIKSDERLEALVKSDSLSAGFLLAIKDLEIRGAGEILGSKQSGAIESVGLEMYLRLLNKTLKHLEKGFLKKDYSFIEKKVSVNLGQSALIPSDYLPDVNQRLLLYSRIVNACSEEELKNIQVEMINRFGLLTKEINTLMIQSEISLLAEQKKIFEINSIGNYFILNFTGGKKTLKKEQDIKGDFSYLIDHINAM